MDEQPPRRPRGPSWGTMGFVVGCIALFVVCLFGGTVLVMPADRFPKHTGCANHLRQIGGLLCVEALEHGAYPDHGGAPLLFEWRRAHFIQRGREAVFIYPDDPDAREPVGAAASLLYETVDVTDAAALAPLCSYAVRDFARFPVDPDGKDPETGEVAWVACDRQGADGRTPHHEGGLNVLFADGAVQLWDRERLGIADDEPIVVGPDSPHPELRKMVFVPGR